MKHFGIFLMLFGALLPASTAEPENRINIWAGQEQVISLPRAGKWELTTEHGRILVSGDSKDTGAEVNIPALAPGTFVDARFTQWIDGRKCLYRKVRVWSRNIPLVSDFIVEFENEMLERNVRNRFLLACTASAERPPGIFICSRVPEKFADGLTLVFPCKHEFPIKLDARWRNVSLHHSKIAGTLSVSMDKKERILDNRGDWSYAVLRDGKIKIVVLSPEFDFEEIENILMLKNIIEGKEK